MLVVCLVFGFWVVVLPSCWPYRCFFLVFFGLTPTRCSLKMLFTEATKKSSKRRERLERVRGFGGAPGLVAWKNGSMRVGADQGEVDDRCYARKRG